MTLQEEFLGGPNSRSASKLDDSQKGWNSTSSLAVGVFPKQMLKVQSDLVQRACCAWHLSTCICWA